MGTGQGIWMGCEGESEVIYVSSSAVDEPWRFSLSVSDSEGMSSTAATTHNYSKYTRSES
jgi:hypothetical protein